MNKKSVLIVGAGSIGNHLSNAFRTRGHQIDIFDTDFEALRRTRENIYPERYGSWDEAIGTFSGKSVSELKGPYDIVCIGTPPGGHVAIALEVLGWEQKPELILIEKPLCEPQNDELAVLETAASDERVQLFVDYNHMYSPGYLRFVEMSRGFELEDLTILKVRWNENWKGIFNAHPWLDGPKDSYLGRTAAGGGGHCLSILMA